MNDILKQERQKLHMAADNMRQMIQVIRERDEKYFLWAWQHKDLIDLKDKLTAKLFKKLRMDQLTDEDLKRFTRKFIAFIQDMSLQFELAEFEE